MDQTIMLLLTFVVVLVISFFSTMVGGAGLIIVPFLISLGLSPQSALATNIFGNLGYSVGSIPVFFRKKKIRWEFGLWLALFSSAGAFIGANIVLKLDSGMFQKIIGVALVMMLPIVLLKKELKENKKVSTVKIWFGYFIIFLIGIYGGIISGAQGTLAYYAMMIFFGLTLVEAAATEKISGFFVTVTALSVFILNGMVDYLFGIVLIISNTLGSYLGAHAMIKTDYKWIKLLFAVAVVAFAIKLLFF